MGHLWYNTPMNFLSPNWLWLYAGAFLMLAELTAPGFVIFFFGLAAATLGVVMSCLPDALQPSLTMQLALFSALSILYLVTLRRYAKKTFLGDSAAAGHVEDEYVGRFAKVTETIKPGIPGRIMLGDAEWSATAAELLEPGTEVKVVSRENLTMAVARP